MVAKYNDSGQADPLLFTRALDAATSAGECLRVASATLATPLPLSTLLVYSIQAGMRAYLRLSAILALLALCLAGCHDGKDLTAYTVQTGGSVRRGRALIVQYRCNSCHMIPGVSGDGQFGPPLIAMGRRTYIAGEFPNIPQNLVRWVQEPTAMKPKTAMPDLGINHQQAIDIAAYLQTLR